MSCENERTLDSFRNCPFHAEFLALDFVTWPIGSLTICVAIPSHLASAAKEQTGFSSQVAVVARMYHVLGLDADRRSS
jgi:hypothetical protein